MIQSKLTKLILIVCVLFLSTFLLILYAIYNNNIICVWILMALFSLFLYFEDKISPLLKTKKLEKRIKVESKEIAVSIDAWKSELMDESITSHRLKEIYTMLNAQESSRFNAHIFPLIAKNPNCPPDVLAHLVLPYPHAVAQNPAFELMLIENEFLPKIPQSSARWLLSRQDISPKIVSAFMLHPDPHIREEAKFHIHTAGEIAKNDADWETELADDIVKNLLTEGAEPDLSLLKSGDAVPEWVESRLKTPIPFQVKIQPKQKKNAVWRREILLQKRSLTAKCQLVQFLAIIHLKQPTHHPKAGLSLITQQPWWYRLAIALNPATPLITREFLAKDGNRYVRATAKKYLNDPKWTFSP
jgi:hypothetical protein